MNAPKIFPGQWHIFGHSQPPVIGTLRFEPDSGLTLEAQRHRQPDLLQMFDVAGSFQAPQVIQGVEGNGTPVTLFGCIATQTNSSRAFDQFHIRPLHALVGAHFDQFTDARFSSSTVSYSILDAWLTRSALVPVPHERGTLMDQRPPPDITTTLPVGTIVTITMSLNREQTVSSFAMGQSQFVRFVYPNPLPILSISNDYVDILAKLLWFLSGHEVFIDQVKFPLSQPTSAEIEWLHSNPGITRAKRTLHPLETIIPYQEIAPHLPTLITSWFQYQDHMQPILDLYFTVLSKRGSIPSSARFLLLAQALEAYHGRSGRFGSEIQPTQEFIRRRDALVDLVPTNERSWLREKLSFANQKTLAQRLDDLILDQRAHVALFIDDTTLFANTIRWTRNYYTHFAENEEDRIDRGQGRIAQGADLIRYSIQMQALLELLFIADLHLPGTAVGRVVDRAKGARVISA